MTVRYLVAVGLSGLLCVASVSATDDHDKHDKRDAPVGLLKAVREATEEFRDVNRAMGAGYASVGSCVTGPERGAMGIHYANGTLIGDGVLDAAAPELLIYEQRGSRLHLVGVEFLVLAEAWDASHPDGAPPVLMGRLGWCRRVGARRCRRSSGRRGGGVRRVFRSLGRRGRGRRRCSRRCG